jgi:hypothetical protein
MIINLLDGRQINDAAITLTPSNQRFYLNETGEDLTRLIRQADKRTFAGFDAALTNELYYQEAHPNAPEVGSTSVTANFFDQILTDPLAAPADAAAGAADTLKKAVTSNTAVIIGGVLIFGLILYFAPRKL